MGNSMHIIIQVSMNICISVWSVSRNGVARFLLCIVTEDNC